MNRARTSRTLLSVVLLTVASLGGTTDAGIPGSPITAYAAGGSVATRLDAYAAAQEQSHHFSGSVVVAQGNTVLLSKGYGWSNWSSRRPNTARTQFPQWQDDVVAAAILQLAEAGKLHLGGSVCRYISGCPSSWVPITVQDPLAGTSGLHDYLNQPAHGSVVGKSLSLAQLVGYITREPIDGPPGQSCCALNADVPVEEDIVERVSGDSFATYVQRHFIQPLGLTQTGYYTHVPPQLPGLAVGYASWQLPGQNIEDYDTSFDGGLMYTSPADYSRFSQALFGGKLLSAASTAGLVATAYAAKPPVAYGSGVSNVGTTVAGFGILSFHGYTILLNNWNLSDIGVGGLDLYVPNQHISVTVLDNDASASSNDQLPQILAQLFNAGSGPAVVKSTAPTS